MADILKVKGPDGEWVGIPAIIGPQGKSAYQVAIDNGFEGTEEEWLASLKGADGTMTFDDLTDEQKASLKGDKGEPGQDSTVPGPVGPIGATGADGKSAYQLAVDNGFEGTIEDWFASLKGAKGEPGQDGAPGPQGERGVQGPTGPNGNTPIRGTDYWTAEDQAAIINAVVARFTDGEATAF